MPRVKETGSDSHLLSLFVSWAVNFASSSLFKKDAKVFSLNIKSNRETGKVTLIYPPSFLEPGLVFSGHVSLSPWDFLCCYQWLLLNKTHKSKGKQLHLVFMYIFSLLFLCLKSTYIESVQKEVQTRTFFFLFMSFLENERDWRQRKKRNINNQLHDVYTRDDGSKSHGRQ